jgi:dTDP-glucose 4,6-dehydratase
LELLVTGGCGFIGSNFVLWTLDKYPDVSIVVVDSFSHGANVRNLEGADRKRLRLVRGDISDAGLMKKVIKEVDCVVNLAAETHVDRSIAGPWPFFESNVRGVLTILEALRTTKRRIRFLQVSSDEVYGSIRRGSATESSPQRPSSAYAASKGAADAFCVAYHKTHDIDVAITRCTNNFGRFQFPEKLIPKTVVRSALGLKVPVYGTGRNKRDWIFVEDHCEAIDRVLREGRAGEIYNIAGKNELTNLQVVGEVLRLLGKGRDQIEFVEDRPGHDERYSLDSRKIERELRWRPSFDFKSALQTTVEWYRDNSRWWKPIAKPDVIHPTPWKARTNQRPSLP